MAALLKLAGIPRSTYYYVLSRLDRPDKHASLREAIHEICAKNLGRYGYRRVTLDLHESGIVTNHKLVMKLMQEEQLTCQVRMKKYRSYRGEIGKVAPDLIQRDFSATAPNQKWTTDITEFSLFGSKLYLSPILDMFNSEIVEYTISDRPVFKQVTDMVDAAFSRIPDGTDLVFHSDQGWQYQHPRYQKRLQDKGVRQSMSRKGNCLDNSIMKNSLEYLSRNCSICRPLSHLNTSSVSSLNILTTTTTAESSLN